MKKILKRLRKFFRQLLETRSRKGLRPLKRWRFFRKNMIADIFKVKLTELSRNPKTPELIESIFIGIKHHIHSYLVLNK